MRRSETKSGWNKWVIWNTRKDVNGAVKCSRHRKWRQDIVPTAVIFCFLDGYERTYNIEEYTKSVAEKIKPWTDIPVSIGVASCKTLAKIGSKFAKKYKGHHSVCMIDNDDKRRKALQLFDLSDVWGIGKQTLAQTELLRCHKSARVCSEKRKLG